MSARLPLPPFGGPVTARAFPMILGVAPLVAAALLLAERIAGSESAEPGSDAPSPTAPARDRLVPARVAIWLLVHVTVLQWAGLILATTVFLCGLTLVFHRRRPAQALAAAIGFTIAVYLLFAHGLGIALPAGLLG